MTGGADPRATIAAAMTTLRPLPRAERCGRVSLWTMYYLGALIVPAITTGVRTGRAPATAIDALTCTLDHDGHVVGFLPRRMDVWADPGHGFDELVEHLQIMVADCAILAGFPAKVAWSKAAVTIDHAIGEARRADVLCAEALGAAEALIAGAGHPLLSHPFRAGERRICCLRYLMAGGTLCPGICPRAAPRRAR